MQAVIFASLLATGLFGLIVACVTDIRERNIPNEVVLYVLLSGIGLRLAFSPNLLWLSVAGAVFLVVVLGQVARFGIIGGGDAKLLAATMFLLPPEHDAQLMVNVGIAGGVLSCVYLATRMALRRRLALQTVSAGHGHARADEEPTFVSLALLNIRSGEPMPYALAIAAGVGYSILTEAVSCVSGTSCSL